MKRDTIQTAPINQCKRCGTCCRKGGPGLHLEDQPLVESGKIPLKHLMTLRQGEPTFDNVAVTTAPAVTDIIIVKSIRENTSECVYYDPAKRGCRIYGHHPLECRALKCWDTREIKNIYSCRRLTRRHLLSKVKGLWELVQDHQQRCDYAYISELAAKIRQNLHAAEAEQALLELIRYDQHLRSVTLERITIDHEVLTFLLGRPLSSTIKLFKLKITNTGKSVRRETGGSQVCYRRNGF